MIRIGKISKNEEEYYFAYDNGKWREVKLKNKVFHSLKGARYIEGEINETDGTIIKHVYKREGTISSEYLVFENGQLKELSLECKSVERILSSDVEVCEKGLFKVYKYDGKFFDDKQRLYDYVYNSLKREFDNELVKVEGKIKAETEKAYLLSVKGKEIWIPKSLSVLQEGYLEVPLWFAKNNSLIGEKEYNQIISEKMKKYEEELSKIVFI